jgi:hypothetical protein
MSNEPRYEIHVFGFEGGRQHRRWYLYAKGTDRETMRDHAMQLSKDRAVRLVDLRGGDYNASTGQHRPVVMFTNEQGKELRP